MSGNRISYPAPAFCQFDDEEVVLRLGGIIFPGTVERIPRENGLRLWVAGNPRDPASAAVASKTAVTHFQILLGALRAWRPDVGRLSEEVRGGLGTGPVRDDSGNQYISMTTLIVYAIPDHQLDALGLAVRRGLESSEPLRQALEIHGRLNRTSADYYMIHELAENEFGGKQGIRDRLGISKTRQDEFTRSANRLSPSAGGRHAKATHEVPLDLDGQNTFISALMMSWIDTYRSG